DRRSLTEPEKQPLHHCPSYIGTLRQCIQAYRFCQYPSLGYSVFECSVSQCLISAWKRAFTHRNRKSCSDCSAKSDAGPVCGKKTWPRCWVSANPSSASTKRGNDGLTCWSFGTFARRLASP